jgi:hypothetical protein
MSQTSDPPIVHECGCEICRKFRENNIESQVEKDAYKRRHQETFARHQAINRLMANTDERNRRMIAGLVSRLLIPPAKDKEGKLEEPEETAPLGKTAIITGFSPRTIRRGWEELIREHYAVALDKVTPPRRARRKGGGRKRVPRSG